VIQNQKPSWGLRLTGFFDGFFVDNVLPIAVINVPIYVTLGLIWWSIARTRRETRQP
jgi:hypothetical protein